MNVAQPALKSPASRRRGFTTPVMVGVLLVAMLGTALILDRLWLEAARLELTTAAEAAALAAGRQLASDDRLRSFTSAETLMDEAVQAAVMTAAQNRTAGAPVIIEERDVWFPEASGTSEPFTTASLYNDRAPLPSTVVVTASRTRYRGNPVALFISGLTRQPFGDAVGLAAASIDGNVMGVRPLAGSTVPGIPLAIWWRDPTGERKDTWEAAITLRQGRDDYGYDELRRVVTNEPDGIPELTLRTPGTGEPASRANLQLLDIGSGFRNVDLLRQFESGWSLADLSEWGGELRIAAQSPGISPPADILRPPAASGSANNTPPASTSLANSADATSATGSGSMATPPVEGLMLRGLPRLEAADRTALEQIVGQPRIVLLYSSATASDAGQQPGIAQLPGSSQLQAVNCMQLVAVRVLRVLDQRDGSCQVVVQPTVIATRTALVQPTPQSTTGTFGDSLPVDLPQPVPFTDRSQPSCIYRLQLTDALPPATSAAPEIALAGDSDPL